MMRFILKIAAILVIFFFIYNPPLKFFPVNAGMIIGFGFFVFYVAQWLFKIIASQKIIFKKEILLMVAVIVLLVAFSSFVTFFKQTGDYQISKNYLSFLLIYLPGAFGIVQVFKKYFTPAELIKFFITAVVAQSLILLFMFVNPFVKDFFFSLLRDEEARIFQNRVSGGFRFLGFAFGGSWDLSIVQSVAVMLIAMNIKTGAGKNNIFTALSFLVLMASVFLAGRTGVLGIVFALLIMMIPVTFTEIPFYRFVRFLLLFCLITIPLFFIIKSRLPDKAVAIVETKFLPWALEMFKNDSGNMMQTKSSNELKTMYFMPSATTFLLGDGYYKDPMDTNKYYKGTDAGYMRHLLFYGIAGCFFLIILYVVLFYQMYRHSGVIGTSPAVKIFIVFIGLYFFLSHIKGDLLAGSNMPLKMLLFLYAVLLSYDIPKKGITLDDSNT